MAHHFNQDDSREAWLTMDKFFKVCLSFGVGFGLVMFMAWGIINEI